MVSDEICCFFRRGGRCSEDGKDCCDGDPEEEVEDAGGGRSVTGVGGFEICLDRKDGGVCEGDNGDVGGLVVVEGSVCFWSEPLVDFRIDFFRCCCCVVVGDGCDVCG